MGMVVRSDNIVYSNLLGRGGGWIELGLIVSENRCAFIIILIIYIFKLTKQGAGWRKKIVFGHPKRTGIKGLSYIIQALTDTIGGKSWCCLEGLNFIFFTNCMKGFIQNHVAYICHCKCL